MVKIGRCTLSAGTPRIVSVVDEIVPVDNLLQLKGIADLLEMRIDCYRQPIGKIVEYVGEVRRKTLFPMIGTVRENEYTRNNRPEIFKAIMPFVDCIDIELGASINDEVLACASGKTIIVSEHDFEKTPDDSSLGLIVDRAINQGGHIVKIATMARSREDVVRLMQFVRSRKEPMVVFAMGRIGTISRLIAPLFGSLFTYGYIIRPVAPGQLSVKELYYEIKKYFPE